jgi:predicted PurR-regulated permease PerM
MALWVVFQIKDILLMLFVSVILMSALNPAIDRLEKLRVPRSLAIFVVYILLLSFIGLIVAVVIPPLVQQTRDLAVRLPQAIFQIEVLNNNQRVIADHFVGRLGTLPENIIRISVGLFGNLITILTTLVITFYLLLERKHLDKYLSSLIGRATPVKMTKTINEIERRLGGWVRGELILMLVIGVMTYGGLLVLGIESALPLAIIAGVLEIIPNIGPTISAIPAILIALTIHPLTALATLALYFLVQLLENNFLVPKIMQRAVGVNPLVSILGLMVGLRLAGPAGAILAIPLIIVIQTIGLNAFWNSLPGEV